MQIIDEKYSFKADDDWGCYGLDGNYIKGDFDKNGYCCHRFLCKDGKTHHLREHRYKWEFFNGKIPEGMEIDHIIPVRNGGTNKLSNLRLVTRKENLNNPISIENQKNVQTGKPNLKNSKQVFQYTLDGKLIAIWPSIAEAGRNGLSVCSIWKCCNFIQDNYENHKWSYNALEFEKNQ